MGHAELKRAILDVSLQLGTELGEDGLTMRAIARRLGVSATALYQHFESKGAILRELRFHGLGRLNQHLAPAFLNPDPVQQLRRHSVLYLEFARNNSWMYDLLTESPEDWGPDTEPRREAALKTILAVRQAFEAARAAGRLLDGVDIDQAPLMMWAALHGMALLMETGRVSPHHSHFPTDEEHIVIERYADLVARGFVTL